MSDAGCCPGPTMGVSGGGGDPRWAIVVDVDAVESTRLIELVLLALKRALAAADDAFCVPDGGGKYCWW